MQWIPTKSQRIISLARIFSQSGNRHLFLHQLTQTANDWTLRCPVRAYSSSKENLDIDFSDTKKGFQAKSTFALYRAFLVFQSCQFRFIVSNAEKLLRYSYSILGDNITDAILKKTYFAHFCAGENEKEIIPVINDYERHGIGSILDYAAEADITDDTIEVIEGLSDEERGENIIE